MPATCKCEWSAEEVTVAKLGQMTDRTKLFG